MPRHYSPEDRAYALERFVANGGDVDRTSRELGISPRTLYEWRKSANMLDSDRQNLRNLQHIRQEDMVTSTDSKSLSVHGEGFREGLPPDDLQALRDLKARMLELARYIMIDDHIKQAIDAAPLSQRIAAATQLIDRIIKLGTQLPTEQNEEVEIEEVVLMYEGEVVDEEADRHEDFDEEAAPESADYFR